MIKKLIDKFNNIEGLRYLIVGGIVTVFSFLSFTLFNKVLFIKLTEDLNITISNILSFIFTIILAFILNKTYVFKNTENKTLKQSILFFICRIITLVLETYGIILIVHMLHLDSLLGKVIVTVFGIILNYIFSKFIVFRKQKSI